jgi:hypothetical protein
MPRPADNTTAAAKLPERGLLVAGSRPPLTVEVRPDPAAAPGDVVSALAALVLERARRRVAGRAA